MSSKNKMRLSDHDASFLYTETASGPMHSNTISVVDGEVSFAEIFEFYAERIHLVPRLRQKVAYVPFNVAHPCWVDDPDFDLEHHMQTHVVPPGTTVEEAIDVAVKLGEPLLDRSRPLWVVYVIEGVAGHTLLAQISHHAFVDGATLVAMSTVLTTPEPDPLPPEPAEPWDPGPVPLPMTLWNEAVREQAETALETMQKLPSLPTPEMTRKVGALMVRLVKPVMQAPWNAGLVGPGRQLQVLEYAIEDFKGVRRSLGGTINDVALTAIVEGVARYMAGKGERTTNQQLRLMCPVNIRGESDDPLDMEGNKVSGMFPLFDAGPKTIEDRFEEVCTEMQLIKERGEAETMAYLQSQPQLPPVAMTAMQTVGTPLDPTLLAARVPSPVIPNLGFRPQQIGINFTFTNIPGPFWTQYIAGKQVMQTCGTLMLGGNLGLGTALGSMDQKMFFSLTSDPRLLPELDQLKQLIADAFAELQALSAA